jgi:hypothetical protein
MSRPLFRYLAAAVIVAVFIFVIPPVGVIAAVIALAVIPPWGRTQSERLIISALVLLAIVAVVFPRNGSTPISELSAHILLAAVVVSSAALRAIPRLQDVKLPRTKISDALFAGFLILSVLWLMSAYIGTNDYETLSGMFFTGWDNHGHFVTFSNTYAVGSTTWPTVDGSEAWNQWYPSLHTTAWSLGQYAWSGSGLSRVSILFPYLTWQAISFASCIAALSWMAGDLAQRVLPTITKKRSAALGALAFTLAALFFTLGSPALMFNAGFVNFVMGVTAVMLCSYFSVRTTRSAVTLGWFLVPVGAIVSINLWTPLALGIVPAGLVVLIALFRQNKVTGIIWLVFSAVIAGYLAVTQAQAIIRPGSSASELNSEIGAVGVGMPGFNISLALAMPVLALILIWFFSGTKRQLAIGIAGPPVMFTALAAVFSLGADSAAVSRVSSYYVLKAFSGSLMAFMPVVLALIAVATIYVTRELTLRQQLLAAGGLTLAGTVAYGYVGTTTTQLAPNFTSAPGIQAAKERKAGIDQPLVGEGIIRSAEVAEENPDWTPFLWDGAGTLPNLWVMTLTNVMSVNQQTFYANLPPFPYETSTLEYVGFSQQIDSTLNVNFLWFRDVSGQLVNAWANPRNPVRVMTSRVLIPSSALCQECSL